ncbi:hypothetical protein ACFSL6_16295 [Paenibacillus thailandensis]|uniref:Type IV secretion system protein VirB6 n=1 Tax=Paenibacillus thailandensis TaxID=393250 RepID=A0ABW5R0P5_9BACL
MHNMKWNRLVAGLLVVCGLTCFAGAAAAYAAPEPSVSLRPVQVFDVKAEKVVRTIDNDEQFQAYVKEWVRSVTGFAPQLRPDENCSYVYRIPLAEPVTVSFNRVAIRSEDVFLFYCDGTPPLLLVFDDRRRPYLLLFKADITPFIRKVGLPAL